MFDVIKIDAAFPLIRVENGHKFESVRLKKTVSRAGNETNAIFPLLLQRSHFDLKDFLGPILPSPPLPDTTSTVQCNNAIFLSSKGVIALTSPVVWGAQGHPPSP